MKQEKQKGSAVWMTAAVMYEGDVTPLLAVHYLAMPPSPPPPLQLCAPWVRLHPVSLGSKPPLTGRVSCSLFQPFPSFSPWFHINISLLCRAWHSWNVRRIVPRLSGPVKLSQTCKSEPLMKYINLEHWASIHSIVLFAYKPWGKKRQWGGGKQGEDTLDKRIIEEKSLQWLGLQDYIDTLQYLL